MEKLSSVRVFGGMQTVWRHHSPANNCAMEFAAFVPDHEPGQKLACLFYLSGLTCTWENMMSKAGAQQYAAARDMILIAPDTSPRGDTVANDDAYDFGMGAGFYLNATEAPWAAHYRMEDYVVQDLYDLVCAELPVDRDRIGITGHSMGGHGALTLAMKNPEKFKTLSAFAPIVAPMQVPWGQKAFTGYLGDDQSTWKDYDSCHLMQHRGWQGDILIDQGSADTFLAEQLRPELFQDACQQAGVDLTLRLQEGYDHSYYFIASFIEDHIDWHADQL